jgi:hypothetical protein
MMQPPPAFRRFASTATGKALAATLAVLVSAASAAGQDTMLPILSACTPATTPAMPQRWHAVGLMLPFLRQQLDVGDFTYDGSLPAMRATVYGLESGAVDLLITNTETYQLTGPPDSPDGCIALGQKYTPPTEWLSDKSVCQGEAPLGNKKVQWWKAPSADGRAILQWYATDTRLPWRVMFPTRTAEPAVIGDYGATYFPTFTPVTETKLTRLRDFCIAKARKASDAAAAATTARDLMALGNDISEAERAKRIQTFIPGLSRQACSANSKPPQWPHQFLMTAILSPIQFRWTPLPTMLYYDWDDAGTLVGLMHEARTVPPALELEAVLTKGVGYGIERGPSGGFACAAATPGAVRPEWMTAANCDCKGVIDHNSAFGPNETSVIRACPVRGEGLHVNWSWYTTDGRPILFTEPEAMGLGLNVADYLRWAPGATMDKDAFELPKLCTAAGAAEAHNPPIGNGLPPAMTDNCSDCHTTTRP